MANQVQHPAMISSKSQKSYRDVPSETIRPETYSKEELFLLQVVNL